MIRRVRNWLTDRRFHRFTASIVQSNTPWRVGDLAVCLVDGDTWINLDGLYAGKGPDRDQVLRVSEVGSAHGKRVLHFDEFGGLWWAASGFRKAVLPSIEACETEFVTLLQRIKRKQAA